MEKDLETYEYLVKFNDSVENHINAGQRIVIVQENENFIDAAKSTGYIPQEENTKEFESVPCPMFDVCQQPVYFQLNNSSELIPISVNSIPTVEPSNVFDNTYLLPNLTVEMIEPQHNVLNKHNDVPFIPNPKEASENMDIDSNKHIDGYTEITLSDEQYEILKQKGWILLENKDKIFLLDSSGLHEITNDNDLIIKLKCESNQIIDKNSQPIGCAMKVVMIPENENANRKIVPKQESCNEIGQMDISRLEPVQKEEVLHQAAQDTVVMDMPSTPFKVQQESDSLTDDKNEKVEMEKNLSKVFLKTRYLLKEIPKEIILGKTVKGKNLIARVVKGKCFSKNKSKSNKNLKSETGRDRDINDQQFAKLIQQVLLGTAEKCRMEDISSVATVISQLFRVPDLRPDLNKSKLIVTKTTREENEHGLIEKQSDPTVITGRFIVNGTDGEFVHIPDMLQQDMKNSELEMYGQNYDKAKEKTETAVTEGDMFLHVNITETKDVNNTFRVSVIVNKRYLSLSQVNKMKTKHINAVYACTACAKVFKSQEEFKNHQEYQCAEVPVLTAENELPYTIMKTKEMEIYICNECKAKFVILKECLEHIRTHNVETNQEVGNNSNSIITPDKKQSQIFKCKMCDNTYFHSSSLTKHILAKHIKPK